MYPISGVFNKYLNGFDREFKAKVDINGTIYGMESIISFEVVNEISPSQEFQIGTVYPSKFTLRMRTQDVIPANARIKPYLAMDTGALTWMQADIDWDDAAINWGGGVTDWLPLGEFYIDGREKVNDVWTYTCYDKLIWANVAYVSSLTYPATQQAVWDEICDRLDYTYDSSVVINPAYTVPVAPTGYTMRQVLGFIAGLNAASVYAGKDGPLRFKRFSGTPAPVATFGAYDYIRVKQTNPVKTYTRVVATYDTDDKLSYEAGTGDENHTLQVDNPLATQALTDALLTAINGFSYMPLSMDARGFPQYDPGDEFTFEKYEGRTWLDTHSPWEATETPWDGTTEYRSIILSQKISFRGGLKLTIEAPSKSEQQSEFKVEGSLTQQVNKLNEATVKYGRPYYGITHSRTEGFVVEREDHKSKLTLNSDVMDWQVEGTSRLYFDSLANKLKFGGTLEGVDGIFTGTISGGHIIGGDITIGSGFSVNGSGHMVAVGGEFSGTITAAVITGGQINGTTITGSTVQTKAAGLYPRAFMSISGDYFGVQGSVFESIIIQPFGLSNTPTLRFEGEDGFAQLAQIGEWFNIFTAWGVNIHGTHGVSIGSYGEIEIVGVMRVPSFSNVLNSSGNSIQSTFAQKSFQTSTQVAINGGIPIGTQLLVAGGGSVTWTGVPSHSHTQN